MPVDDTEIFGPITQPTTPNHPPKPNQPLVNQLEVLEQSLGLDLIDSQSSYLNDLNAMANFGEAAVKDSNRVKEEINQRILDGIENALKNLQNVKNFIHATHGPLGKLSKKKFKKCNKCYNWGGGPADRMLHFQKLCLKSILGHSESFW